MPVVNQPTATATVALTKQKKSASPGSETPIATSAPKKTAETTGTVTTPAMINLSPMLICPLCVKEQPFPHSGHFSLQARIVRCDSRHHSSLFVCLELCLTSSEAFFGMSGCSWIGPVQLSVNRRRAKGKPDVRPQAIRFAGLRRRGLSRSLQPPGVHERSFGPAPQPKFAVFRLRRSGSPML
jgi:hypothetical protein